MFEVIGGMIKAARERADSLTVGTAMAAVSFCSGFISYTHISALTQHVGQSWKTAHLMPFCVDGQIVIGSAYFMYGKNWKSRSAGLVFGVIPGIAESLIANWESGIVHGLFAAGWATVPAQAFACSTILFERWLHARREAVPSVASVLAAAPLAMARIAAGLFPQAPEPAAPGPEPEVTACRDLRRALALSPRPAGAPWGLVSPTAAPAPGGVPLSFPLKAAGPSMPLGSRPARQPRQAATTSVSIDRKPLPAEGSDELRALVNSMSRNDLYRQYEVSKHGADKLREQYLNEEVTANVA
jgi:hypothetical protein